MAIHRSGPTPNFYDYVCKYALIPGSAPPTPELQALLVPGALLNWIDIPSFQRGISWDLENVKEFLQSTSVLLGNAILSQQSRNSGQFPHLPASQDKYLVLVDGLQRLAVGTALLSSLHNLVLTPTPSRPGDAVYFTALASHVFPLSPYYLHNDREFSQHFRKAVRDQYLSLRNEICEYVEEEISAGRALQLGQTLGALFLARQLALDTYFNFTRSQLLSTFIGINTVRVDLGPVDLLRAAILENATNASWPQKDLEDVENDLTETLTDDQKPKQSFMPFVNAAIKAINSDKGDRLFPSWSSGLIKADVDAFILFVQEFENSVGGNAYLREIILCGKLPASLVLAHYYADFLHGSKVKPSFFSGGNGTDAYLHAFLICCYRLLVDGTIGRTSDVLEEVVAGGLAIPLDQLADHISNLYIGLPIAAALDANWLETHLNRIDRKRAPRVFNAMLLPVKTSPGGAFAPKIFGPKSTMYAVDHLVPESTLKLDQPGGVEGNTLRNFAPLPSNQNRQAKATSCSSKLGPGPTAIYRAYVTSATAPHHYCAWLLTTCVSPYDAVLDVQDNLQRLSVPDVGTHRIQFIRDELLKRL